MIAFRPLRTTDLDKIVALMRETRASFAGLSSTRSLRALCLEAMARVSVVVAEEHDTIVGYVAAVVDHERYWRGLAIRRPTLAVEILHHRILKFVRRRRRETRSRSTIATSSTSSALKTYWTESSSSIGKIVHVGVRASARGQGIGTGLYRRLFELMRLRGVRRIDARIDVANTASVELHRACGFALELLDDGWIATVEL